MSASASFVKSLLAQCCLGGICEWVVCPGARNMALLQVLAAAEDLVKWTHFDERSAAFFALGRIQDMGLPVAVVTTSGTAAAELLPAVVEAYYQRRPLLLLTADRPADYRGSAAPQAIEQADLFGIYAPTIDLETPDSLPEDILEDWDYASPLHINVCLPDPDPAWNPGNCDLYPAEPPEENDFRGSLAELAREECSPTSMLLLLPDNRPGAAPVLPLGLPADFYEKENNLITAEEVRAVILSKLRLPAWGVLWDVGAGSGSIGLEAAALRPGLSVYGLERQAGRLELMRRNCRRLGCVNYACMQGEAPEALDALPKPDRIFTGGGGAGLESIMQACFDALNPGGLLVASAVTTESEHLLYGWNAAARTGMFSLDIASESPIAGTYHHLRHGNRITLFTYSRA